jgi:ribosomal protein S20
MARDYAKEYAASRTPKRRLANIMRKRARRLMIKKYGKAALKGKDVDHKDMHPATKNANRASNLQILSEHANREKQPSHK